MCQIIIYENININIHIYYQQKFRKERDWVGELFFSANKFNRPTRWSKRIQ